MTKTILWTSEKVGRLKGLFSKGKSDAEVAAILSNEFGVKITRNAVLGKRMRTLGTKREQAKMAQAKSAQQAPKTAKPKVPKPKKRLLAFAAKSSSGRIHTQTNGATPDADRRLGEYTGPIPARIDGVPVTIMNVTDTTCRWPSGDPKDEDFCFCGHAPQNNSPYCDFHYAIAYQPVSAIKRANR